MRCVAFLRGINVGGNKKIPMALLKQVLSKHEYTDVVTLLASGNIVVSTTKSILDTEKHIEHVLSDYFGFAIPVIVRELKTVQNVAGQTIFSGTENGSKCFVTFLKVVSSKHIQLPYHHPDGGMSILKEDTRIVYSSIDPEAGIGATQLMNTLESLYGKDITTRNWNTIKKIASIA